MKRIFTLYAMTTQRPTIKVRLVSFAKKVAKDEKVNCVCP
jgi:hypothetical protein